MYIVYLLDIYTALKMFNGVYLHLSHVCGDLDCVENVNLQCMEPGSIWEHGCGLKDDRKLWWSESLNGVSMVIKH